MKKVYGPYKRRDGRSIVIHYDTDTGSHRTQSYPRYLMEQVDGQSLTDDKQVDHINDDKTDNRIENFQLLSPLENVQKYNQSINRSPSTILKICDVCGKQFELLSKRYRYGQKLGQTKFFCSRSCSNVYAGRQSGVSRRNKNMGL